MTGLTENQKKRVC